MFNLSKVSLGLENDDDSPVEPDFPFREAGNLPGSYNQQGLASLLPQEEARTPTLSSKNRLEWDVQSPYLSFTLDNAELPRLGDKKESSSSVSPRRLARHGLAKQPSRSNWKLDEPLLIAANVDEKHMADRPSLRIREVKQEKEINELKAKLESMTSLTKRLTSQVKHKEKMTRELKAKDEEVLELKAAVAQLTIFKTNANQVIEELKLKLVDKEKEVTELLESNPTEDMVPKAMVDREIKRLSDLLEEGSVRLKVVMQEMHETKQRESQRICFNCFNNKSSYSNTSTPTIRQKLTPRHFPPDRLTPEDSDLQTLSQELSEVNTDLRALESILEAVKSRKKLNLSVLLGRNKPSPRQDLGVVELCLAEAKSIKACINSVKDLLAELFSAQVGRITPTQDFS